MIFSHNTDKMAFTIKILDDRRAVLEISKQPQQAYHLQEFIHRRIRFASQNCVEVRPYDSGNTYDHQVYIRGRGGWEGGDRSEFKIEPHSELLEFISHLYTGLVETGERNGD